MSPQQALQRQLDISQQITQNFKDFIRQNKVFKAQCSLVGCGTCKFSSLEIPQSVESRNQEFLDNFKQNVKNGVYLKNKACLLTPGHDCTKNKKSLENKPLETKKISIEAYNASQNVEKIKNSIKFWCNQFLKVGNSISRGYYFYGITGCGKTTLLNNVYRYIFENYCPKYLFYGFSNDLLSKIQRNDFETKDEAKERFFDNLAKKHIIFLDDFNIENKRRDDLEFYETFIDFIYRKNIILIISSNQDFGMIKTFSSRIYSRFIGMSILVEFPKYDFRELQFEKMEI